jgi:exosortase A
VIGAKSYLFGEKFLMNDTNYWIKTACGLVLITLLSIFAFFDTWRSMVEIWYNSSSYNQCFLIAPISVWLCWSQRSTYLKFVPKISWLALLALMLNGFLWLVADLISVQLVKQLAVVGMIISGFWMILGNRVTFKIFFPLSYLFFMVPAGSDFIAPLMEVTADISVKLIRLSGIPVYKEGMNLTLTSGNWTVAEACSGINYLIASVSLGFVYAYITFSTYWKRALFLALAVIIPILANGVRAYLIVMLGHFSNMTLAVGVDHIIYGALFFGLIMLLLFYISSHFADAPIYENKNLSHSPQEDATFPNQPFVIALVLIGVLSFVYPLSSTWLANQKQTPVSSETIEMALLKKGWKLVENPNWQWLPQFQGVEKDAMLYFSNGQATFGIYEASFGQESQGGGELVNSENLIVTKEQSHVWKTVKSDSMQIVDLAAGETVLSNIERHLVILRWYQIGSHHTNNAYKAKIFQLLKRLTNDLAVESQVILLTDAPKLDYEQAELALKKTAEIWLQ